MQGDFHIGERLVQPRLNSIQHEGSALHLEPKVMQVLLVLASKPGEVFTREEIRQVVWRDVFVGDDVLMRAVSEIRRVFEDNPQASHTIQTVPKVGYRLIAPVINHLDKTGSPEAESALASTAKTLVPSSEKLAPTPPEGTILQTASHPRRRWFWYVVTAAAVLIAITIGAALLMPIRSMPVERSFVSHPLTTYSGSQLQPALSPGGDTVAFIWNQSGREGHHIYVKALKSGAPIRMTTGDDQEYSPAWSPDGLSLAFIRQSASASSVNVMPALGGSEKQVYTFPRSTVGEYEGLAWSGDGDHLIFPEQRTPDGPREMVELSLTSHATRLLTTPPVNWDGDSMPSVSPDGKLLAFARGSEQSTRDLFVIDFAGGAPRQLTHDAHLILGLDWTADGSSIVFSSNRGGSMGLWRISPKGGEPERDPVGTDGAYWPTVSRHGDLLAYSHGSASWSIAAVSLGAGASRTETNVLTSSEQDSAPSVSPEANLLAFQSWRSGNQEIWISGSDGSNPTQLTNQGNSAGSPSWSRDGRLLAFDARPDGFAHIYITDSGGASPRQLTSGNFNDIVPNWSADDRWVYFGSNRSGNSQIWRVAADGSTGPQQVTANGGMVAKMSADGAWLYFTKVATAGLWRRSSQGGADQKIFDGPPAVYTNYWTVAGNDVYVLSEQDGHRVVVRIDPKTGLTSQVFTFIHDPAPFSGLTVSVDGKKLFFSELLEARSNLTLVEHFH